jgi:DNA-binding MarR family transcriptional regulator
LRHELRKFQAFSQAAAKNAGLTSQQHQAMLAIKGFSNRAPVSVGALAKLLLVRHHTCVEMADRMTKLGLVSRAVDSADGRRVILELTQQGERRLRKLSNIHFQELLAIGPTLTKILKSISR